jgi:hypothetical protein
MSGDRLPRAPGEVNALVAQRREEWIAPPAQGARLDAFGITTVVAWTFLVHTVKVSQTFFIDTAMVAGMISTNTAVVV